MAGCGWYIAVTWCIRNNQCGNMCSTCQALGCDNGSGLWKGGILTHRYIGT